ncbi:uncharacterized membrane protein YgdD (TMEM256/DUF423 family) [Pullulanibacillus pueri]|uniref:UPF0382 membrane protein YwdK n=1 Tax=Pullulanibacillus pueri TaxID=1437324 RepID=A0A8J3EN71_9BACL|nr:DUF423 domain-containing protein [Pullulanibacillus pueri]MBM7683181.1 uncharacterized membrane protein YgdD (TMEM256/DUF423 family) [Pullulanibacillus pueri]GGH85648.1 UPF0382 membrane protein YwdK [Pullulanibacillus pueri]
MFKLFTILGSANAFLAIALGAFGAHGLKNKLTQHYLDIYNTGVQYHMMHALGLILVGFLADKFSSQLVGWAGWIMFIGIILFSGSLYILSISGIGKLGAITPLGGVAFLVSWVLVIIAIAKS